MTKLTAKGGAKESEAVIFLATLVAGGLLALALALGLQLGVVTTRCLLLFTTGIPCPGCGGTRTLQLLLQGSLHEAWIANPGVVAGVVVWMAFTAYCAMVVIFQTTPFWKTTSLKWLWVGAGSALMVGLLNWIYLIWHR